MLSQISILVFFTVFASATSITINKDNAHKPTGGPCTTVGVKVDTNSSGQKDLIINLGVNNANDADGTCHISKADFDGTTASDLKCSNPVGDADAATTKLDETLRITHKVEGTQTKFMLFGATTSSSATMVSATFQSAVTADELTVSSYTHQGGSCT